MIVQICVTVWKYKFLVKKNGIKKFWRKIQSDDKIIACENNDTKQAHLTNLKLQDSVLSSFWSKLFDNLFGKCILPFLAMCSSFNS